MYLITLNFTVKVIKYILFMDFITIKVQKY